MDASLVSLVIPIFNERENLGPLMAEIRAAMAGHPYEVILVDDGSTDGSADRVLQFAREDRRVKAVIFKRNFGQTAAMAAGFHEAEGDVIVSLDADGQNDPADIPAVLLPRLTDEWDIVAGWRHPRDDPFWSRQLPSRIANALIAKMTGVPLHDFGCTLRAYRYYTLEDLALYGEMHRFLPAWCAWRGSRVTEVKVHHRPRQKGKSKYGLSRTFKVLIGLVTAKFISGYFTRPNYIFGGTGLFLYAVGGISFLTAIYDKLGPDRWGPYRVPLLLFAVFMGIVGTLLITLGLISELIVRSFFRSGEKRPYRIQQILSLSKAPHQPVVGSSRKQTTQRPSENKI